MHRLFRSGRAPAVFFPTRATHTSASANLASAAARQELELSQIALRKAEATAAMRELEIDVALREVELGVAKAKASAGAAREEVELSAARAAVGADAAAKALEKKLDISKALLHWGFFLLAGAIIVTAANK